jgi:hypothetical protein
MRLQLANLHSHYSILHCYLFREEVGAYRGFVACAELLIDLQELLSAIKCTKRTKLEERVRFNLAYVLVHQTSFADTTVTKDNNLSCKV